MVRLALTPHLPPELVEIIVEEVRQGTHEDFTRQDVDVNGDGQKEIVITDEVFQRESSYIAIIGLGKDAENNSKSRCRELFFLEDLGHYCYHMRAKVQQTRVIADSLECWGGTGVFEYIWTQHWIECYVESCKKIWSAELFYSVRGIGSSSYRRYAIANLEQPDSKTIFLTTHNFGIEGVACKDCPLDRARRVIGPDVRDVYQWNGETWDFLKHEQISQGIEITREYDESATQSSWFIGNILHEQFGVDTPGGGRSFDLDKTRAALYEFFDLQVPQSPDDAAWKTRYNQPALEVAASDGRGINFAAILARIDIPSCRLAVRRFENEHFLPIGLVDISCIDTFTHLSWVDIDGDGKDELLLLTISPDVDATQQLHIYRVDSTLKELTRVSGEINGADGVGIKWEQTRDGFTLHTGLPLAEMDRPTCPQRTFSCITFDRRFQTYRWDTVSNKFVSALP